MKKIVPFSKEIPFKTRIAEVTDIEVTHCLKIDNNEVNGSFLVDGTYKITDESINQEEFSYDLPFTVDVADNYDLNEAIIKINDFYFEIINEEILKINVELEINNVKEREVIPVRCYDEEDEIDFDDFDEIDDIDDLDDIFEDKQIQKEVVETPKINQNNKLNSEILDEFKDDIVKPEKRPDNVKINDNNNKTNITDMFNNINQEDSYKSYYVYVIRENDTLDTILNKYKITKEDLEMYNDLNDLKIGKKLIIPCSNE